MRAAAVILLVLAACSFGQSESPDPSSFDIEPPVLIPNRQDEVAAEPKPANSSPDLDLAKLEKEFERAKRNAANADHFCKIGALSKVELEQRMLRLAHLESDVANARLTLAKEEMLQKPKEPNTGENGKHTSSQTESSLALAIEAAHTAAAKREQADIDAAEANVQRQKKLLSFGRARKSDVVRAEQKLADLRSAKN